MITSQWTGMFKMTGYDQFHFLINKGWWETIWCVWSQSWRSSQDALVHTARPGSWAAWTASAPEDSGFCSILCRGWRSMVQGSCRWTLGVEMVHMESVTSPSTTHWHESAQKLVPTSIFFYLYEYRWQNIQMINMWAIQWQPFKNMYEISCS